MDFSWLLRYKQHKIGLERSTITGEDGSKYMMRTILHLGFASLRLHTIYRPDSARDPHDHPFWFVTIPLAGYTEIVEPEDGSPSYYRKVSALVPAFRDKGFRHTIVAIEKSPVYTLVLTGPYAEDWGFYTPTGYVSWRDY